MQKDIVITSALRTAVGSLGKSLKNIPAYSLGAEVITNLIKNSNCEEKDIDAMAWNRRIVSIKKYAREESIR